MKKGSENKTEKKTVKKVDKRPVNFSFIPIYLKREKGTDYRLLDVAVTDLKTVKFLYAKYCKNNKDAHYYVYTKAGKKKESKLKIVNAGAVMYKRADILVVQYLMKNLHILCICRGTIKKLKAGK